MDAKEESRAEIIQRMLYVTDEKYIFCLTNISQYYIAMYLIDVPAHKVLVLIAYVKMPQINFGLNLHPYFVYASRQGCGQS